MVCLGFVSRGCRMVGVDETTELWRPPKDIYYLVCLSGTNEIETVMVIQSKTFSHVLTYGVECVVIVLKRFSHFH